MDEASSRLLSRFGRPFGAGDVLFREGEASDVAFLLQEGRVRIYKVVHRTERTLLLLGPGDLFGESALLERSPRNASAVALSEGLALALDRTTFHSIAQSHPELSIRVLEQLVRRIRDAEDQIEMMLISDGMLKITTLLLKLSLRDGARLRLSPVEVAARIGVDVDNVKRSISRLREQQYVRIQGDDLELVDREALQALHELLLTKQEILRHDAAR